MDAERFSKQAAALQSLVIAFAVVVGGIWALYRFKVLEDVVSLQLSLDARQLSRTPDDPLALVITLTAQNNGTRPIMLDLSTSPLILQRISRTGDKYIAVQTWNVDSISRYQSGDRPAEESVGWMLNAKSTKTLTFYQEVDAPGTYFATFSAPVAAELLHKVGDTQTTAAAIAAHRNGRYVADFWGAETYVIVTRLYANGTSANVTPTL